MTANRSPFRRTARTVGLLSTLALAAAAASCGGEGGDIAITNIEPRVGALSNQQPVKVMGQNFRTDIGYTVYFGTERAPSVTILDPETLLVVTPAVDESQTVDMIVAADNGPAFRVAEAFTFEEMAGDVVGGIGEGASSSKKGNLQY